MNGLKWLVVVLACGMAVPAMGAALVTEGSNEIAISGNLEFASEVGTKFDMDVKYAYFFWDRISLGSRVVLGNNDA